MAELYDVLLRLRREAKRARIEDRVSFWESAEAALIQVHVRGEDRTIYIGQVAGRGFFLTYDPGKVPTEFFPLPDEDEAVLDKLLGLPGGEVDHETAADRSTRNQQTIARLLQAVEAGNPPDELESIVDGFASSPDTIDILGLVTTLRTRRRELDEFKKLMAARPTPAEREFQYLLQRNHWMFGGHYTEVAFSEKQFWLGARADLILSHVTGYLDLVELKRPDMRLLVRDGQRRFFRPSSELTEAIAQADHYLKILDEHRLEIEEELTREDLPARMLYRSHAVVVAGRTPRSHSERNALRDINSSHARILVFTFDDLAAVADSVISVMGTQVSSRLAQNLLA